MTILNISVNVSTVSKHIACINSLEPFYKLSDWGDVLSISLFPSQADSNFRCSCYPPYNPLGQLYRVPENEIYPFSDENSIKAELDGAFLQATNMGKPFSINLVVYLGKDDSQKKYKVFTEKAWQAWNYRGYPHEGLKIINGGRREKFQVDFFILPRENPPPVPTPDNPSEYCLEKGLK